MKHRTGQSSATACRSLGAAVLLVAVVYCSAMAEEVDSWKVYSGKRPVEANALRYNIEACVAACRRHADPASASDWMASRESFTAELKAAIGLDPWPEKTPLHAEITGRADRDGYTIENLLFQSLPDFYITANVYVPKDAPRPMPAIVVTAGHAMETGKNYDLYRTAQLNLVRQGFLVLAYDPIGQGERRPRGNSHTLSYPATLVGHTSLRYMLWDSIRALDYLESRPEVDPKRIGITGNSGGGLNTMYAMPVEPRFAAAVACCCPCSYEVWLKDGGDHCICNHIPGICQKMEQFHFVGLCAPRPFLSASGQKDTIFPIAGVRDTIRRAGRLYGFAGHPERVSLFEGPVPHGWSQPIREATYGWFARWLLERGDGSPTAEPPTVVEDAKSPDLHVLKDGKLPEGAKTYAQLLREEADRLIRDYAPTPADGPDQVAWAAGLRTKLWETLGGRPEPIEPRGQARGTFTWEDYPATRWTVQTEPRFEIPAVLVRPQKAGPAASAVIMLHRDGKQAVSKLPLVKRLLEAGVCVLAIDVRGTGEDQGNANQCASDAIVLGRPLLAQQAWDVMAAADWLKKSEGFQRVAVYGQESAGIIALLAAALSDDLQAVALEKTVGSFVETIADPLPAPLWAYAPNLLKVADLPQLAAMCAPRPLLRAGVVGGEGKDSAAETSPEEMARFLAKAVKEP